MPRLNGIVEASLDEEQRALHASIVGGPRVAAAGSRKLADAEGRLAGPFNAWLRNPRLGHAWSEVGETLRFGTGIDRGVFETVVVTVAAHYRCAYEWAAHSRLAVRAGVDTTWLEQLAVGSDALPEDSDAGAACVATRELLARGRIGAANYAALIERLGESGAFEVVSAAGYYSALAMALNAFEVDPPEGFTDPWEGQV